MSAAFAQNRRHAVESPRDTAMFQQQTWILEIDIRLRVFLLWLSRCPALVSTSTQKSYMLGTCFVPTR